MNATDSDNWVLGCWKHDIVPFSDINEELQSIINLHLIDFGKSRVHLMDEVSYQKWQKMKEGTVFKQDLQLHQLLPLSLLFVVWSVGKFPSRGQRDMCSTRKGNLRRVLKGLQQACNLGHTR